MDDVNNNAEDPAIININKADSPAEEDDDEVCASPDGLIYTTPSRPAFPVNKVKCHAKGCPGLPESVHTQLITCSADDCIKQVHRICYEKMVRKSKKPRAELPTVEFCTCACQDKYQKSTANSHLNWRNDGKNGVDDAEHSEHYIVQWLLTGDNFAKWRSP